MTKYFLDNDLIVSEAHFSVHDPALLNGDGVFTTLIVKEGRVEFLDLHLERLKRHAAFINLSFESFSKKNLADLLIKSGADRGIWKCKIILIPDKPYLQSSMRKTGRILVFIEPTELDIGPKSLCLYPEEVAGPLSRVKTLSYLERHYLSHYAKERGFDEALVCYKGFITEAAFANFFWIENDTLFYSPKTFPYLFGITLSQIIEAAKKIGILVSEKKISLKDLSTNSHCFLSNALKGFCSVSNIEAISFSRNKTFEDSLRVSFENLAKNKSFVVKKK